VAQFTAVFGFAFVLPFLPVFLHDDLAVRGSSELAFWTGLTLGATGLTMALSNPVWGAVADRFGRKQMIVRAMLGGGFAVALMGIVQTPLQLVGARLLFGLVAGSMAASSALVAAQTPPAAIGRALGILNSGVALGRTFGPLLGGILASLFTFRHVFLGSGIALCVATLIVIFGAKESAVPADRTRPSFRRLTAAGDRTLGAIITLVAALGMMQFAYSAAQGLLVLRLLTLDASHAQLFTGVAFAAAGLMTVAVATTYWKAVEVIGYQKFAVLSGLLLAFAVTWLALVTSAVMVIAGNALLGLAFGAIIPALSSMIALEAPTLVKGTAFGLSTASAALGMAVGPLMAGLVASVAGVHIGLFVAATGAVMAAALVYFRGREPLTTFAVTTRELTTGAETGKKAP
jgi:DHA1 family multidrug resistance protein-like MFS transporter